MARPERFELPTYCSGGNRSIQLSYGRAVHANYTVAEWSEGPAEFGSDGEMPGSAGSSAGCYTAAAASESCPATWAGTGAAAAAESRSREAAGMAQQTLLLGHFLPGGRNGARAFIF